MRTPPTAVLLAVGLLACSPAADMLPATPPAVIAPPAETEAPVVPASAKVSGTARAFVSAASMREPSAADAPVRAVREALKQGAQGAAPSAATLRPVAPSDALPRKVLGEGKTGVASEIVPGDFIVGTRERTEPADTLRRLAAERFGLRCTFVTWGSQTLQLFHCIQRDGSALDDAQTRAFVDRFGRPEGVAFIETNGIAHAQRTPNDTHYAKQWHYRAMGLPAAWDVTTGSPSVVVAILDTGSGAHPDLDANLLPGIDMVSDVTTASDGDGRDDDPTDDAGPIDRRNGGSGWHGTHVAGTIGATSNDGVGVAGVAWGVKLLPVRVLGLGGGTEIDIAAGITWACGGIVPGVRTNTRPAVVLNLSLAGAGGPSQAYQSAIDDAAARGAVIVVAAGNSGQETRTVKPCNQANVICVAATDLRGAATEYSNFGAEVTLAAPGGAIDRDDDGDGFPDGVLSTVGAAGLEYMQGTSMASPHVAGLVALMKSIDAQIDFAAARAALVAACTPVANCGVGVCGAGMVDAAKVLRALKPVSGAEPGRLAANVSSVVLTAQAPKQAVRLSNVGGSPILVEFVGDGPEAAAMTWNPAQVPLPIGAGQSVVIDIAYTNAITRDFDQPLAFRTATDSVEVVARVRKPRPPPTALVALVREDASGKFEIAAIGQAANDGSYALDAVAGRYLIVGFSDDDGDGDLEDGEGIGIWPSLDDPQWQDVQNGVDYAGRDFAIAPTSPTPNTPVGGACSSNAACGAGNLCATQWPGGLCTRSCDGVSCGEGGVCVMFDQGPWCVLACAQPAQGQGSCRSGYACKRLEEGSGACLP